MARELTVAGLLTKAQRALDGARVLLDVGNTEGACNRAYYAMHDAARAALLDAGLESPEKIIKTHRGLIAEFGSSYVATISTSSWAARSTEWKI